MDTVYKLSSGTVDSTERHCLQQTNWVVVVNNNGQDQDDVDGDICQCN